MVFCLFLRCHRRTLHKLADKLVLRQEPLALTKLMTSPAVEGTWICTGGLIKKLKNRLSLIFSPDFTLKGLIWLFYTEKWIFLEKLQRA